MAIVAACASFGPLLFVTDGLKTYIDVVRCAFRTRQTGTGGRPRRVLDTPPSGPHPSIDVPAVMSLDWQPRR